MGSLEELYVGAYPRLVRVLGAAAPTLQEAEEVVQEAFVRLISRWDQVQAYQDPEAWVRAVAMRLLLDRHRKRRNGLRAVTRLAGGSTAVAGPTADRVDVDRALARLPVEQRVVLVLHHLVGLDVTAVAAELEVPVGTVKSRLARGRDALAPLLREEPDRV